MHTSNLIKILPLAAFESYFNVDLLTFFQYNEITFYWKGLLVYDLYHFASRSICSSNFQKV